MNLNQKLIDLIIVLVEYRYKYLRIYVLPDS